MSVRYDPTRRTFDAAPTLDDHAVLEFCRTGHLLLRDVIPEAINRRACDWLDGRIPAEPETIPDGMTPADLERIRASHEPSSIFLETWFREGVLLNPAVAGAVRALLGPDVGLPVLASHHRVDCPAPAQAWHHDADHVFGPELHFVEVFYFPQDTPVELGPTELVPGTHLGPSRRAEDAPGLFADGPAGTVGIHHQSILHRRGRSTATGVRHMLKYSYWRTSPPRRDWIVRPDFDVATATYGGHGDARYVAHLFHWLCGRGDDCRTLGGQAWPWRSANQIGPSYGYGTRDGYLPDWSRTRPDGFTP